MRNPDARVLLAILLCAVACTRPDAAVVIVPHLRTAVPADVPTSRPRLGVGHVLDARPRGDREVRQPGLRLRWYGLVRQGERQTGDRSFRGSVADGIRRDAVATLARSGVFSSVSPVEVTPLGAVGRAGRDDVDLVLIATIEEFVGVQAQDALVSFFLLGGIYNRLGDSIGLVRIRYELYNAAGKVFEETLETVHRSSSGAPTEAVLDATARMHERLADRLFARLVPLDARVRRAVPIRVVDGCGLGHARVEQLLREASGVFEREAGVGLHLDARVSSPGAFNDLDAALAALALEEPPRAGIVLGLTRAGPRRRDARFGLSVPLGRFAVVACEERGDARTSTVAHEIGHLFGAVHVASRGSVMNPVAEFDSRFFDRLNRRILRVTWDRPFEGPLPARQLRELDQLYRSALRLHDGIEREEIWTLLASLAAPDR